MEILKNTFFIPENRQLTLTLPDTIAVGEAEIAFVIQPKTSSRSMPTEEGLLKLIGLLKGSPNFNKDPLEAQALIRQASYE